MVSVLPNRAVNPTTSKSEKFMSLTRNLRAVIVVTLALFAGAASAQSVTVVEFYNKALDAYFITGRLAEQQSLDGLSGFMRTGMTFEASAATSASSTSKRICRFYINLASPPTSTHFYGREGVDCEQIQAQSLAGFSYEGFDFAIPEPNGGTCALGTKAVYRAFRTSANGKTANHRYTTSAATYEVTQTQGYVGEGVAFCAASSTDVPPVAPIQKCGTFYYPGLRISYRSVNSEGTTDSFQRSLDNTYYSFNGQSNAKAVVELAASGNTSSTMIIDGAEAWAVLGTSSVDAEGLNEIYYSNRTVYPRNFAATQSVVIDRELVYSRPNFFGPVTQDGAVTLVGLEDIAVASGAYGRTCKFTAQLVTKYPGPGVTTTTASTHWVADGVGIVKTITNVDTVFASGSKTHATIAIEALSVRPL